MGGGGGGQLKAVQNAASDILRPEELNKCVTSTPRAQWTPELSLQIQPSV